MCSLAPVAATKSFSTCSRSPARSSPWSTNTHVSRSPIARWTSAAATAESTPPDSPQIARPSPICSRIAATVSSMIEEIVQPGAMPGDVVQEAAQHLLAVRGVPDLGVVLHAGQPPLPVLERRDRRPLRRRRHREALGRPHDRVAVAHPHRVPGRQARVQGPGVVGDGQLGAAVLARPVRRDLAAERPRHRLEAVAQSQHRHARR